jgi:hypothetical protein
MTALQGVATSIGTTDGSKAVIERARIGARFVPSLRLLGQLGLIIAVQAGADQIYSRATSMTIPGQGTIYRLWTGEDWNPAVPQTYTLNYSIDNSGPSTCSPSCPVFDTDGRPKIANMGPCVVAAAPCIAGGTGSYANYYPPAGWYLKGSGSGTSSFFDCMNPFGTNAAFTDANATSVFMSRPGTFINETGAANGNCSVANTYWVKELDDTSAANRIRSKATDVNGYNNAPNRLSGTYTQPSSATTGDRTNIAISFGGDEGGGSSDPQTIDQATAECDLVRAINSSASCTPAPGAGGTTTTAPTVVFAPFAIPKPYAYETAGQYVERVRLRGWTGSATSADETSSTAIAANTAAGYNAAAATKVTTASSTADVLAWPLNAPMITTADQAVALTTQPLSAPSPTASPDVAPCGSVADPCHTVNDSPPDTGSGSGLNMPAISSPCDKFPFGVFCWITSAVSSMVTATPAAPYIHLPTIAVPLGGTLGMPDYWNTPDLRYDFGTLPDAVWVPLYIIAGALVFFIWLVGLYYAGTRLHLPAATPDAGE